ncbi:hypothetical protein [Fluviispira sanaruensis]|nr:hypothetical protein [Fluviispira sanaruensis]
MIFIEHITSIFGFIKNNIKLFTGVITIIPTLKYFYSKYTVYKNEKKIDRFRSCKNQNKEFIELKIVEFKKDIIWKNDIKKLKFYKSDSIFYTSNNLTIRNIDIPVGYHFYKIKGKKIIQINIIDNKYKIKDKIKIFYDENIIDKFYQPKTHYNNLLLYQGKECIEDKENIENYNKIIN